MYHRSSVGGLRSAAATAEADEPPLARQPAPVRSSMNSRQLAGRDSGLALIARRIAQLTRGERVGTNSRGSGKSFLIFLIQHSSGVVLANGTAPVTSM